MIIPSQLKMTIAQITNAVTIPSGSPVVTNNGLPFGDNVTLSPAVAISGDIVGFGNDPAVTLAYFGLDQGAGTWSTGTAWVAAISGATYTGSIPIASNQFAALVMTPDYWASFLAANPATNGVITVTALPSPATSPGQVLLSTTIQPGDGCSVLWGTGQMPNETLESRAYTLAPGQICPTGQSFPVLQVQETDYPVTYYVAGVEVQPTDPAFITGLLYGTPYVQNPQQQLSSFPNAEALATLTLQGLSTDGSTTGGYFCVMLYQGSDASLYLLIGAAGPGNQLFTKGVVLWQAQQNMTMTMQLTGLVTVFSDKVLFTVGSASGQSTPTLGSLMQAEAKVAPMILKMLFSFLLG